jgi:hypothetical protein
MDARSENARHRLGKNDVETNRQRMPSDSVPLRDRVPRRFGLHICRTVQTQSLQHFLFEKLWL